MTPRDRSRWWKWARPVRGINNRGGGYIRLLLDPRDGVPTGEVPFAVVHPAMTTPGLVPERFCISSIFESGCGSHGGASTFFPAQWYIRPAAASCQSLRYSGQRRDIHPPGCFVLSGCFRLNVRLARPQRIMPPSRCICVCSARAGLLMRVPVETAVLTGPVAAALIGRPAVIMLGRTEDLIVGADAYYG